MSSLRNGLYNYSCQNKKIISFILYLILAILYLYILWNYKGLISNSDLSVFYYSFSTIVQGFLALVGFLGSLSVYKLQLIETEASKVSQGLEPSIAMYKGEHVARTYSWIEMMNECGYILDNKESNWEIDKVRSGHEKFIKLRDEKNSVRNSMLDFSVMSMVNIIFALIMLPLSKLLITNNLLFWSVALLLINVSLSLFSAKKAISVIRKCLGYGFTL